MNSKSIPEVTIELSENSQSTHERPNMEWVSALCGDFGSKEQEDAHQELWNYLFAVAAKDLRMRQSVVNRLSYYGPDELSTLAEDFVQQFYYKLMRDDYALLSKYGGHGRFVAWSAQVLRNLIRSEMRRREWQETVCFDEQTIDLQGPTIVQGSSRPEVVFQSNQIADFLENALAPLSARNQTIFLRYVVDGERANVVANELGISTSGVYTAAHRIRERMGDLLVEAGYA